MRLRDGLLPRYSELIYYGYWFAPEMELLQASWTRPRAGDRRGGLKLYKGNVIVLGRRSPNSLYRPDIATFEADTVYDQADATGFIRLERPQAAHPPRPGAGPRNRNGSK